MELLIYNILGELINKIDIYQNQLGIKNFKISHNGHLYCLGLFDQTLRIFNNISYTCITIFNHDKDILNDSKVNYYKEVITNSEGESKYTELKPLIYLIILCQKLVLGKWRFLMIIIIWQLKMIICRMFYLYGI